VDQVTRPEAGKPEPGTPRQTQPEAHVKPSEAYPRSTADDTPPDEEPRGGRGERASLATIARNPRLPIWERRIAIALVAGIAVTFIFDWRIGITVAVIAAIGDAIYRSQHAAIAEPARGVVQRKTERRLEKLTRAGFLALNERAIPGSDEVIDHLVIGPTGVYAIDSERWDKRIPVRVIGGKQLFHGPFNRKDRLMHARWEAAQATELIQHALGRRVDVRPSLAIYGPKIPWAVLTVRNVDVFSADHLGKYLRRGGQKTKRGPRLSGEEVDEIYDAAARVLPARY